MMILKAKLIMVRISAIMISMMLARIDKKKMIEGMKDMSNNRIRRTLMSFMKKTTSMVDMISNRLVN